MSDLKMPVHLVEEGQIVRGIVVNIADFGMFIEIVPHRLDGILKFGQTPYLEIARTFKIGDEVEVIVKSVHVQRESIRLELLPDPTRYEAFWKSNVKPNSPS